MPRGLGLVAGTICSQQPNISIDIIAGLLVCFSDLFFLLSPEGVGDWAEILGGSAIPSRPVTKAEQAPKHFAGGPKISLISKSPWSGTYQILS